MSQENQVGKRNQDEEEKLLDGSEAELGVLRTSNWGSQAVLG